MQPNKNRKQRQLRIEMPKDPASYANAVMISNTSSNSEIIFDFMQIMPNDPRARVQNRIVMTPTHAKMFLNALKQNLDRFEAKYGEIELPKGPPTLADQLFGGVATPDADGNIRADDESDDDDDE